MAYALILFFGYLGVLIFALWWFAPSHVPHLYNDWRHLIEVSMYVLLSFIIWHQIVNEIFIWYLAAGMKEVIPLKAQAGLRVAMITAFVPGKEPYEVLEKALSAMVSCEYPHDTWLLDEGNDPLAKEICARYGVYHFSRKERAEYNQVEGKFKAKTKGGNFNSWYHAHSHQYDIVAQHDVDFIPVKHFLTSTLGYFRDPKVAFVGTPQIYGNHSESWIARGAAEQAFNFYGHIQRGLFGHDMLLLIGANHIMRTQAHAHIGGYAGHIVEDHLTGMHLYTKAWKSVYVPQILAIGEGPSTWGGYFSQQMRWAYGLMHIYFTQSPKILPKMRLKHALHFFFLQQYYFDGIAQGIAIVLLTLYFVFGIEAMSAQVLPMVILYGSVLLYQLGISLWLEQYFIDPVNEASYLVRGRLLNLAVWPIYMLAFFKVITGKSLQYKVTPKGKAQRQSTPLHLFYPHAILGSITLAGIIISNWTGHQAPHLLILAALNTTLMYGFFGMILMENTIDRLHASSTMRQSFGKIRLSQFASS